MNLYTKLLKDIPVPRPSGFKQALFGTWPWWSWALALIAISAAPASFHSEQTMMAAAGGWIVGAVAALTWASWCFKRGHWGATTYLTVTTVNGVISGVRVTGVDLWNQFDPDVTIHLASEGAVIQADVKCVVEASSMN